MLKSIEYSVTFPTTGRSFQNRIEFAPGLTAITGRNEAGKTLNLEMIAYCLFGKAALRGLATDYKDLSATLALMIGERDVLIARAKKETMTVDGEVVAVGAEAINKEVPKLLGFGLDVFNVACAAQQGDLDALTKMRPTERRQMIDRLVGIDLLEAIEKECKAEAKTADAVATSLVLSLPVPQEPVQPDDYQPSESVAAELAAVEDHERTRHALEAVREPTAPVAPEAPAETNVVMLENHENDRQAKLQVQARLEGRLAGMPEPTVSRDDLARAIAYAEYQAEVCRRGPKPEHDRAPLRQYEIDWAIIDAHSHDDLVTCPKCDHQFDARSGVEAIVMPEQPPLSRAQITTEFRRHELWAEPLEEVAEFVLPNLQKEIQAHAHADDRADLRDKLRQLVIPADRSGELRAARDYQRAAAVHDERVARYNEDLATFTDARARLGGMDDRSVELAILRARLAEARTFEGQLDRYRAEQTRYDDVMATAAGHRLRSEGFGRGALALRGVRLRVKQELAPDLSRAASSLVSAMTDGERRQIIVDEDFNILVDGQPIQTLSGSGKSVVNLALRIGLGQVLTSKVLPIFLGDEIDKDMDAVRAGATHGTMQNLRQYLSQIIIVTHKEDFVADSQVMMSA